VSLPKNSWQTCANPGDLVARVTKFCVMSAGQILCTTVGHELRLPRCITVASCCTINHVTYDHIRSGVAWLLSVVALHAKHSDDSMTMSSKIFFVSQQRLVQYSLNYNFQVWHGCCYM
jgi:hypothetical protein